MHIQLRQSGLLLRNVKIVGICKLELFIKKNAKNGNQTINVNSRQYLDRAHGNLHEILSTR